MGDMALMRTLGMDIGDEKGNTLVTASTGRRAKGTQREVAPPLILSAERKSISGACLAIEGLSESYIFYGYVDQLILGEELAEDIGVLNALEYFLQDTELGLGTKGWIVRGTASDALQSGGDSGAEKRLETLHLDSKLGAIGMTRSVGEVLSELLEEGASYMPALSLSDENDMLMEAGYAVLRGEQLVGWIEGEDAYGLERLAEQKSADVFEGTAPSGDVVLRLGDGETTFRPVLKEGAVVGGEVNCTVMADCLEYPPELSEAERDVLCGEIEARERKRVEGALDQMQRLDADCVGLMRGMGISAPWHWAEIEQMSFSDLPIKVNVQVTIQQ